MNKYRISWYYKGEDPRFCIRDIVIICGDTINEQNALNVVLTQLKFEHVEECFSNPNDIIIDEIVEIKKEGDF